MFDSLIDYLTGNDVEEENEKEFEEVKKVKLPIQKAELTTLPKQKSLEEAYKDQLTFALSHAKHEMQDFMDNLPEERFSSGYLQEDYNGIKPNLESIIVPARVCAQGTTRALTRTGSLYENERETLITEAKRIFKNLSDNILNSMFNDIELGLRNMLLKHNVTNIKRFRFRKKFSFYWMTDLVSYKLPQYENVKSFRVTPNTLEIITVSVYTSVQTELSDFLIENHIEGDEKIMDDFFTNYANHIRAYIYDTIVELVRISKLVIGGLERKGIDYYKYEDHQFYPACLVEE